MEFFFSPKNCVDHNDQNVQSPQTSNVPECPKGPKCPKRPKCAKCPNKAISKQLGCDLRVINLVETKRYSNGPFSKMLDYITIEYLLYSLMLYLHCFTSGDKKNI